MPSDHSAPNVPSSTPADAYLTLSEAAHTLPGRPHTSTLWRWARRGVMARTGERVWLDHARFGGRVFTTRVWLQEFGQRLADADLTHFESRDSHIFGAGPIASVRCGTRRRAKVRTEVECAPAEFDEIDAELAAEGLC